MSLDVAIASEKTLVGWGCVCHDKQAVRVVEKSDRDIYTQLLCTLLSPLCAHALDKYNTYMVINTTGIELS